MAYAEGFLAFFFSWGFVRKEELGGGRRRDISGSGNLSFGEFGWGELVKQGKIFTLLEMREKHWRKSIFYAVNEPDSIFLLSKSKRELSFEYFESWVTTKRSINWIEIVYSGTQKYLTIYTNFYSAVKRRQMHFLSKNFLSQHHPNKIPP